MKKIFTLTAILAAMCIMTSCGDKKDNNSQSESSVPETATTSEAAETTAESADTTQAETVSTKPKHQFLPKNTSIRRQLPPP